VDEETTTADAGRLRLDQTEDHLDSNRRIRGAPAGTQDSQPRLGGMRIGR
jgi:hypothetical protein